MYATLTELKTYLGVSGTADDTLLTDCITRAQAAIEAFCGRAFEAAGDSTRYFDAGRDVDGATLYFDADVCQLTSVVNGDGVTVSSDEYVTEPRNTSPYRAIMLKADADVSWTYADAPENAIAVTGRWAFSTSAPADVTQACIRLAAALYRQKDVPAADDTAEGLPGDVAALLGRYRRL